MTGLGSPNIGNMIADLQAKYPLSYVPVYMYTVLAYNQPPNYYFSTDSSPVVANDYYNYDYSGPTFAFVVAATNIANTLMEVQCINSDGYYFLSTSEDCEGSTFVENLGFVASVPNAYTLSRYVNSASQYYSTTGSPPDSSWSLSDPSLLGWTFPLDYICQSTDVVYISCPQSFESPITDTSTPGYITGPHTTTPWIWSADGGISGNGGPWDPQDPPDGTQWAILQAPSGANSSMSAMYSGWQSDTTYTISFYSVSRTDDPTDIVLSVDVAGVQVYSSAVTNTAWPSSPTTVSFTSEVVGDAAVTFTATPTETTDMSVFVDVITVSVSS